MLFLKRTGPLMVAFVLGVTFFLQAFIPHPWSDLALTFVTKWIIVIAGVSLLLGLGSLVTIHFAKIRKGVQGWGYSVVLLVCLFGTAGAGFYPVKGEDGAYLKPTEPGTPVFWVYDNAMRPAAATMFSILGFFIASAAFRAFRARSVEATLLLLAAVIIMLGQIPFGYMAWKGIPDVAAWVLQVPNTAAKRAIIFGVTLGSIAASLRIIFGIERSYLGGGRD